MEFRTALDRAASFIMDPANNSRSPTKQKLAWATTVLLCIGTVGISLGLSALWRKIRQVEKNDTHEKIAQIFHRTSRKNTPTDEIEPTEEPEETTLTESEVAPPSLQTIAKELYAQREELWQTALNETDGSKQEALQAFIILINAELLKNGTNLKSLAEDDAALNTLFQSGRIRIGLVAFAQAMNETRILDKHLQFLAQNIYDQRDELTARAAQGNIRNIPQMMAKMTLLLRAEFAKEGRSLSEVFNNPQALEIFKNSERLTLALLLYARMKSAQEAPEDPKVQNARRQARKDAAGQGVVTVLGAKEFADDPENLRKAARKFLQLNHPDKNPDADMARVQAATDVVNMLKDDVYLEYNKALIAERAKL